MSRRRAASAVWLATAVVLAGCTSSAPPGRTAAGPGTAGSATPTGAASVTPTHPPSATASVSSGRPRITTRVLPWHLPGPLSRSVALVVGPRVLLAGGLSPGDHSSDQVLSLDPVHGVTGPTGRLAEPLHDSAGAVLAGRPTVIGGGGATELADVQRRDQRGRWHVTGRLPAARSDLSVVASGRRGLVIGGYDGRTAPTSVLRTDGRRFTVVGALPAGVRYAGVAADRGAVWILGGEVGGRELTSVLRLDPATGRVRTVARMPHPLGHEAVVAVGPRLLVLGGRTAPDAVTGRMWWFDTRTGGWSRAGRLPYPVADAAWARRGTRGYLIGGETPGFTSHVVRVGWSG